MSAVEISGWIALGTGAAAVIAAVLTFIINRRVADDSRSLGMINAGQASLEAALDQANKDINALRKQVREMRGELNTALLHHEECEQERRVLLDEVAVLRRRMDQQ